MPTRAWIVDDSIAPRAMSNVFAQVSYLTTPQETERNTYLDTQKTHQRMKLKLQILLVPTEIASLPPSDITPVKKFLHLADSESTIRDICDDLIERYYRLYPESESLDVEGVQDNDCCDLDPGYSAGEVFSSGDILRIIIKNGERSVSRSSSVPSTSAHNSFNTSRRPFQENGFDSSGVGAAKRAKTIWSVIQDSFVSSTNRSVDLEEVESDSRTQENHKEHSSLHLPPPDEASESGRKITPHKTRSPKAANNGRRITSGMLSAPPISDRNAQDGGINSAEITVPPNTSTREESIIVPSDALHHSTDINPLNSGNESEYIDNGTESEDSVSQRSVRKRTISNHENSAIKMSPPPLVISKTPSKKAPILTSTPYQQRTRPNSRKDDKNVQSSPAPGHIHVSAVENGTSHGSPRPRLSSSPGVTEDSPSSQIAEETRAENSPSSIPGQTQRDLVELVGRISVPDLLNFQNQDPRISEAQSATELRSMEISQRVVADDSNKSLRPTPQQMLQRAEELPHPFSDFASKKELASCVGKLKELDGKLSEHSLTSNPVSGSHVTVTTPKNNRHVSLGKQLVITPISNNLLVDLDISAEYFSKDKKILGLKPINILSKRQTSLAKSLSHNTPDPIQDHSLPQDLERPNSNVATKASSANTSTSDANAKTKRTDGTDQNPSSSNTEKIARRTRSKESVAQNDYTKVSNSNSDPEKSSKKRSRSMKNGDTDSKSAKNSGGKRNPITSKDDDESSPGSKSESDCATSGSNNSTSSSESDSDSDTSSHKKVKRSPVTTGREPSSGRLLPKRLVSSQTAPKHNSTFEIINKPVDHTRAPGGRGTGKPKVIPQIKKPNLLSLTDLIKRGVPEVLDMSQNKVAKTGKASLPPAKLFEKREGSSGSELESDSESNSSDSSDSSDGSESEEESRFVSLKKVTRKSPKRNKNGGFSSLMKDMNKR